MAAGGGVVIGYPPGADEWTGEPDTEGPSRFTRTLMRRSELRALPPVEPLIDGVLSRRSSAVLVGPTQVGKTLTSLAWACSVATGTPWLGRGTHRAPVLYVVGEGANGLDARVNAWEQAWRTKVDDEALTFAVKPDSLRNHRTWREMGEAARDLRAGLVVLDTFSSLAWDADEVKDAPLITRWMSDLAGHIEGNTLLVHHPGWSDAGRTRGGSQFESNVDEVVVLRGNGHSDLVQLERKKVKEGPSGGTFWLRRRALFGSCVMESARASDADEPMRDRILRVLAVMEGPTGPQLCKELGAEDGKRTTVLHPLRDLARQGAVVKDGKRGRERYFLASPDTDAEPSGAFG